MDQVVVAINSSETCWIRNSCPRPVPSYVTTLGNGTPDPGNDRVAGTTSPELKEISIVGGPSQKLNGLWPSFIATT